MTQGIGLARQLDRDKGRGAHGLHAAARLGLLVRAVGLGGLHGEQGQAQKERREIFFSFYFKAIPKAFEFVFSF